MSASRQYEPPKITSLTSEEILDLMGPAQAVGSEEFVPADIGSGDAAGANGRRKVAGT